MSKIFPIALVTLFLAGCGGSVNSEHLTQAANYCGGYQKIHQINVAGHAANYFCKTELKND